MILDLRDYTTRRGSRDRLIERCETVLFPEQARLGARFPGLFRDAEDPERFVWLRAMRDLPARKRVLTAFYTHGALWQAQRFEVNHWIRSSSDVLLVRPVSRWGRPGQGDSIVGMYTHLGRRPPRDPARLRRAVTAAIRASGGRLLVTLATEPAENNYPRHPIRTGEHGFVWFATFRPGRLQTLGLRGVLERRLLPTATSRMR